MNDKRNIAHMATYRSTRELKAMANRTLSRRSTDYDAEDRPITARREHRLGAALCFAAGALLLASIAVLGVWGGLYLFDVSRGTF